VNQLQGGVLFLSARKCILTREEHTYYGRDDESVWVSKCAAPTCSCFLDYILYNSERGSPGFCGVCQSKGKRNWDTFGLLNVQWCCIHYSCRLGRINVVDLQQVHTCTLYIVYWFQLVFIFRGKFLVFFGMNVTLFKPSIHIAISGKACSITITSNVTLDCLSLNVLHVLCSGSERGLVSYWE